MIKRPRLVWRHLSSSLFAEVVSFLPTEDVLTCSLVCRVWGSEMDHWKLQGSTCRESFLAKRRFLHSFRGGGRKIVNVAEQDEVRYMNAQYVQKGNTEGGMFVDVSVCQLSDSISLCVVDFDGVGGCSSLTFSPDTGTVIMERKSATNGGITGEYFQSLTNCHSYTRCGVHVSPRSISFYRKQKTSSWETTGIISDCSWVVGGIITPCIAFRDPGPYNIQINRVTSTHPPNVIESPHKGVWKSIGSLHDEDTDSTTSD
jgi:F-box domain